MASFRFNTFVVLIITILLLSISLISRANARSLGMERWLGKQDLLVESLRGEVPPSGSSSCTYIPGGTGKCPSLNEKHFAGGSAHAPPTFSET
ncbi:hypothetical protein ACS0TY_014611 [Phlomoides rotata]